MFKFKEPTTQLNIHAKDLEKETLEQIELYRSHPAFKNLIAIMPDAHLGTGCVIGFTGKFKDGLAIPAVVGVDIGCGMLACKTDIKASTVNLSALDSHIKSIIPMGFSSNNHTTREKLFKDTVMRDDQKAIILNNLHAMDTFFNENKVKMSTLPANQLGTLGGGK